MWTEGQDSNLQSLRSRTNLATKCLSLLVSQFVKQPPDQREKIKIVPQRTNAYMEQKVNLSDFSILKQ